MPHTAPRDFTTDRSYLATCTRFGITPSAIDYAEYLAETEASGPDDVDWNEEE